MEWLQDQRECCMAVPIYCASTVPHAAQYVLPHLGNAAQSSRATLHPSLIMLSYRHAFHAGNHADVLKHMLLLMLLRALQRKDTPFTYFETHAGAGEYDLRGDMATKLDEWKDGIGALRDAADPPSAVAEYLSFIPDTWLYPGSPRIVQAALRAQDRAEFCELHNTEIEKLQDCLAGDRRVLVHHADGFATLRASLPGQSKRGLVMIDPSYETARDYQAVVEAVRWLRRHFRAAVIAIWYPRIPGDASAKMREQLAREDVAEGWVAELDVRPPGPGLYGSGMCVINPPWQVKEALGEVLPWLVSTLSGSQGRWRIQPV